MSNEIVTKDEEVVKLVSESEVLIFHQGWYTRKPVYKKWIEEFKDDTTGELVQLERKELICETGRELTHEVVATLLFSLQCGDIEEVEVSNIRRAAFETVYGRRVYLAIAELRDCGKPKKTKFLYYAKSIPNALEALKDFIELNYEGGYRIISIKEFPTEVIIEDNLKVIGESANEEPKDPKYYQITALITTEEAFEYTANAVVKTDKLDKALMLLNSHLSEKNENKEFQTQLEEAKLIPVDVMISEEFTAAYGN